jgi:hypothetical protein
MALAALIRNGIFLKLLAGGFSTKTLNGFF